MRRGTIPRLFLALIVLAIAYGILKGVLYLKAREVAEDFIIRNSQNAAISYQSISTSLMGKVAYEDVAVRPKNSFEEYKIARVEISGPRIDYLLLSQGFPDEPGFALPRTFRVQFDAIKIPLAGGVIQGLESQVSDFSGTGGSLNDACDSAIRVDGKLLRAMKFEELTVDGAIGYQAPEGGRRVEAYLDLNLEGIQSVRMELALSNIGLDDLRDSKALGVSPKLASALLGVYSDPDFGRNRIHACADRKNLTATQYKAQMMETISTDLEDLGIIPGPGLQSAIDTYFREWGDVQITLSPDEPLGVLSFMFLKPDQLTQKLGIDLVQNEQLVKDLSFHWSPRADSASPLAAMMGEPKVEKKARPPKVRYRYRFVDVPVSALERHLGKSVRVHIKGQPERTGILDTVDGDKLSVVREVHGGKFTSHVKLKDISRLEVRIAEAVKKSVAGK